MNEQASLTELRAFAAVMRHRSFRKAADELELAPSSLSHMIRGLEAKMDLRLLNRTTRSVSPTEAGQNLFARIQPLISDLDAALAEATDRGEEPAGTLRINTSETVARLLLEKIVPTFLARHPRLSIDLVNDGRLVDVVAEGFDAGIRLRESVPQDMVIVPFGGRTRFVVVGSPAYLGQAGRPRVPDDLAEQRCIRHRMPSGKMYRWEFERRGHEIEIDVPGAITLDSITLMVQAAEQGLGLAYVPIEAARDGLDKGTLETVLNDWCPQIEGLCLYYPGRRHVPASLRAFIALLKEL
ncbi:LysR family transcriptional regulator [Oryzifoliimicrobium ureilyticus]|uniref:LysR family transcriptional regulator n=1 Tax=Oryzifoliimicrobium ureilyticus TaxID=3113724 RepID=UPI0030762801